MKLKITILYVFLSIWTFSQTHRFVYELKYKQDSTTDKIDKANMLLDINGNDVQFYEFRAIKIDSLNKNMSGFTNYEYPFPKLKRTLSSKKNENYYFLNDTYFIFDSDDVMKWNITPETKTKNKWTLQKAVTNFGGRSWEAWFTNEIPFSEGPLKFNGLPGLIVELKDDKSNFNFELISIEKPTDSNLDIVKTLFKHQPLKISFKKYNEILMSNYNDPYSRFRSMRPGSWSIGTSDDNYVDTIEGLAKISKEKQADIRKNNNPIELDKAIIYPLK